MAALPYTPETLISTFFNSFRYFNDKINAYFPTGELVGDIFLLFHMGCRGL